MAALHKAICLLAPLALIGSPGIAQDDTSGTIAPTSLEAVLDAVRDCSDATTREGVSNEVLFGKKWKLLGRMDEDGSASRPDLSLPVRAYRKSGDYPVIFVDMRSDARARQCVLLGGYAEDNSFEKLKVALINAYGAPIVSEADGTTAFRAAPDAIFFSRDKNKPREQFRILIQDFEGTSQ
jgi:hypothetical protein